MTQQTTSIAPQTRLQYIVGVFYFAFRALVGAYALTVFLSLLVHFFLDETISDVVALTNSIIHFTTMGATILLPITLILRRRDLALMLAPSAIFWLVWAIPQFLPKNIPQAPPDATEITILTYNLLAGMEYPDDIRRIITEADADIVVLQELNTITAEMLQRDLHEAYPHMELHPGSIPGVGIISRYELSDCILWIEIFKHQRCVVSIGDETVILYNVHPMSPLTVDGFNRRRQDLATILARISADMDAELTIIAAGDWNMTPLSDGYAQVREYLNDSYADVGDGLGFTYRLHNLGRLPLLGGRGIPVVRIDYVFYTAPLIAQEARVWHENGLSDHIPLWVELALP